MLSPIVWCGFINLEGVGMCGYISSEEMDVFNQTLTENILKDTLGCWRRTRLKGVSASMGCDGNISIPLLRALDGIYEGIKEQLKEEEKKR